MVNSYKINSHGKLTVSFHGKLLRVDCDMVNSYILHSYIENAQSINAPSKWTCFSFSSCLIQVFSQNDKWGQIKKTIRGCIHPKRDAPTKVYCEIYHVWCCAFTVRDHMLITYCERFWIMRNTEREGEREREPLCSKRDIACSILTVRVLMHI